MASNDLFNTYYNSYLGEFKRPKFRTDSGFDPDSSYGANMVRGSNRINPSANRNASNALYGMFSQQGNTGTPGIKNPIGSPMSQEGFAGDRFRQMMSNTDDTMQQNYLDTLYEGQGQPFSEKTTLEQAKGFQSGDIPGIAANAGLQMLPMAGRAVGGTYGGLAGSGLKLGAETAMAFAQPEIGVPMLTLDAIRFLSSLFG